MNRNSQPGNSPGKEKGPTGNVEPRSKSLLTTATPLYHNTTPTAYPRQEIIRSRRGGWDLVRWDGFGMELRAWRPYRGAILDLLDRCGGRLTQAAADVVLRGRG